MLVFHVVVINNSCAFCYTAEKEGESFIPEIHNAALFFFSCSKSVISQAQELILVDVTVKKKKKKKMQFVGMLSVLNCKGSFNLNM